MDNGSIAKSTATMACAFGLMIVTAACSGVRANSSVAATASPAGLTQAVQCVQEQVLPKILKIEPVVIKPGSEVKISGSGGYLKDSCGGYFEGSQVFKLYLDNEPMAELSCYVNHCEGNLVLPENIAVGSHCLGVQKGSCQMELEVTAN
jgi:3D (Asp-Asp-Asp) domain-containing protein